MNLSDKELSELRELASELRYEDTKHISSGHQKEIDWAIERQLLPKLKLLESELDLENARYIVHRNGIDFDSATKLVVAIEATYNEKPKVALASFHRDDDLSWKLYVYTKFHPRPLTWAHTDKPPVHLLKMEGVEYVGPVKD